MKLSDLLLVARYTNIELHSGFDGKLVAKNPHSLQKYREVEILSVYTKIHTGRDNDFASPFLYVFGNTADIERIKNGGADDGK